MRWGALVLHCITLRGVCGRRFCPGSRVFAFREEFLHRGQRILDCGKGFCVAGTAFALRAFRLRCGHPVRIAGGHVCVTGSRLQSIAFAIGPSQLRSIRTRLRLNRSLRAAGLWVNLHRPSVPRLRIDAPGLLTNSLQTAGCIGPKGVPKGDGPVSAFRFPLFPRRFSVSLFPRRCSKP